MYKNIYLLICLFILIFIVHLNLSGKALVVVQHKNFNQNLNSVIFSKRDNIKKTKVLINKNSRRNGRRMVVKNKFVKFYCFGLDIVRN